MCILIDKLDDTVNNTTIHVTGQSKWNLPIWSQPHIKKIIREILNLKIRNTKYTTKADLKKNNLRWDTSEFANVDEWDIDKLKTVSIDLSKLSNVVNSDVKKTEYDKLVTKDNAIDTSEFVLIICSTAKLGLEKKINDKKYLLLADLLKKATIQRSLRLKVKHLVLLV